MSRPEGSITRSGTLPSAGCPAQGAEPLRGAALAREDPGTVWESWRRKWGPVVPVEVAGADRAWLVLGYNEALHVASSPGLYACDRRGAAEGRDRPVFGGSGPNALRTDGQEHARLRAAITGSLQRITGFRLRSDAERAATELIDEFAARGSADLVADFAQRLPLRVVTGLVGADEELSRRLAHLVVELDDPTADAAATRAELGNHLLDLAATRRVAPESDLASWLMEHPSELDDDEAAQQLELLLTAAHEPTANLIGGVLRALLTESASGGRVPEALDRVLWQDPPLQALPHRVATRELRLGNADVRVGDLLVLGLAAANADPVLGAADDEFSNRAHLSWGAGPHRCPARELARGITTAAVTALLDRLPSLRLAMDPGELRWRPSPFSRAAAELPVHFEPERTGTSESDAARSATGWNPLAWFRAR